jgi:DMSO reductase anchor subunit
VPTTVYRTRRAQPRNLLPADYFRIAPAPRHTPLVVMLVLSQLSVGTFACGAAARQWLPGVRAALQPAWSLAALAVALVAMAASVCHLGRPRYAYRAVIGLATSWVSREILAFGAFAGLCVAYAGWSLWRLPGAAVCDALGWASAALGLLGVACSVMVYHATRRAWWSAAISGTKFFATTALLGLAGMRVTAAIAGVELSRGARTALVALVIAVAAVKAVSELAPLAHLRDRRYTELRRSAVLMTRDLRHWVIARFAALAVGLVLLAVAQHAAATVASYLVLIAGELLERTLFFAAATTDRMPGAF